MRDLAFALMLLAVFPMAVGRPFNAYLLWGWTGMLAPTAYFYGFMVGARVNLVMALLTLMLLAVGRVQWRNYQKNTLAWLYVLFLVHATLAYLFAYPGNPNNATYHELFIKGMLFAIAMPFFVRERIHFHVMFIVIALGLGVHGLLGGLKTIATAGGHIMQGPQGTMLADRNHLSAALTLVLPLLLYLHANTVNRIFRLGYLGAFCVLVAAILGGGSRGGFIALSVVGVWLVLTTRRKGLAIILVAAAVIGFLAFAPENITNRMTTIQEMDDDASFMGRIYAWRVSSAIALANPVFGGGFHAVQIQPIWDSFKEAPGLFGFMNLPPPTFKAKAAHSIYFEVLGDLGFVGLGIFLIILVRGLRARWIIKKTVGRLGSGYQWARDMADMLMLAILAYMTGGAAVSLAYYEVIYMVVMLMELLKLHVLRAQSTINSAKTSSVVRHPRLDKLVVANAK